MTTIAYDLYRVDYRGTGRSSVVLVRMPGVSFGSPNLAVFLISYHLLIYESNK
jgi:hypothetical protein